jgi:hypothetical protein
VGFSVVATPVACFNAAAAAAAEHMHYVQLGLMPMMMLYVVQRIFLVG